MSAVRVEMEVEVVTVVVVVVVVTLTVVTYVVEIVLAKEINSAHDRMQPLGVS